MELKSNEPDVVEFCGATSGTFELTWGQTQMCEWMQASAPHIEHMNLAVSIECGDPVTLEDLRYALRVLVERHEPLRTRINFHESGRYVQLVCATGRIPLSIRSCTSWADASAVTQDLRSHPFTIFEWPLRIAVVTAGEAICGIVLCISHVMTDGWGLDVISRDLRELLSATPDQRRVLAERPPRPLIQPGEHATAQRAAVGGKGDIRAENFWAAQLSRFPNDRFPVPLRTPGKPRFAKITMQSRAAARALPEAATRCGVTVSAVLMGGLSVLLTAISELDEATFRLFFANRITEESRNSLGSLVQTVPVAIKVSGLPFDEVARSAWKTSLGAYRAGDRDPRRIARIKESVIAARGLNPDLECFLNIHTQNELGGPQHGMGSPSATAEEPTEFRESGGIEEWEAGKFYVDVWQISECLKVSLSADTAFFSHDQIVGFLQHLETILLKVADHPESQTDELVGDAGCLAEIQRVAGLVRMDGCWVDLDEVHRLLTDVWSPRAAQIFLNKDAEGTSLTAYLVLDQGDRGPREVHQALLAELKTRRFVVTPHQYVICRSGPELPATEEEWRLHNVISEGPGR